MQNYVNIKKRVNVNKGALTTDVPYLNTQILFTVIDQL